MPLTIERRVRALDHDESERIARYVDLLREELLTKRPRLSLSGFFLNSAISCVLFGILWVWTLLASDSPAWFITVFWIVVAVPMTVWSWVTDYRDEMKYFRMKQQNFDCISNILDRVPLTTVHVIGSELEDDNGELFIPPDSKHVGFSPEVGDDIVVYEYDESRDIWIVNSKGRLMDRVPD